MPIKFRCVYCEKLLGIARRKAGAVVSCPQCHEKLIVPTPDPEAGEDDRADEDPGTEEAPPAGGGPENMPLFERIDIVEELFSPNSTFRANDNGSPSQASTAPAPPKAANARPPIPEIQDGLVLTSSQTTWLGVAAVIILAVTFGAGVIVGRLLK